ncbi:heme oxygenase-like domain-containing protein [Roseivivax sp.]
MPQDNVAPPQGCRRINPSRALRSATGTAHDAVEAGFAPFMARPARHLTAFLRAQEAAFLALDAARAGPPLPEEAEVLAPMLAGLRADLADHPPLALPVPAPISPMATAYLTLGSRLGTEVIKRHLAAHGLPCPQAFRAAPPAEGWRAFRDRLAHWDPASPAFATLAEDARRGFALFSAAAQRAGLTPLQEAG